MSLNLLLSTALAGTAVYNSEDLQPGELVSPDVLYEVEVPQEYEVSGAFQDGAAEVLGRVPRFVIPEQTRLRPDQFLPVGTEPGLQALCGPDERPFRLPVAKPVMDPNVTDWVDVYVRLQGRWCLAADRVRIVGAEVASGEVHTRQFPPDGPVAFFLGLTDDEASWLEAAGGAVRLALRNETDLEPSKAERCAEPTR